MTKTIHDLTPYAAQYAADHLQRLCHSRAGFVLTYSECEEVEYRIRVRHDTPRQAVANALAGIP